MVTWIHRCSRVGLSLVLVGFLLAGCGTGRQTGRVDVDPGAEPADSLTGREEDRSVHIEVTNDVTPPTSVVIYVLQRTGARYRLGRVQPAHTRRFSYTPREEARRIRLLAQTNQGRTIRSDPFSLAQAGVVRWRLTQVGGPRNHASIRGEEP